MRQILTREQLAQHQSYLSDWDVIWDPLFDFNVYPSAGTSQLSFFSTPQGQGTTSAPGATGTKTLADTNMDTSSQLGKGNQFYVTGLEMLFFPANPIGDGGLGISAVGAFVNNVYNVGKSGVVTLEVGSGRTYIQQGPLQLFPPSTRLAIAAALASTGNTAAATSVGEINYASWSGEVYTIVPLLLDANQTFTFKVTWPAVVAAAAGADHRMGARLRGYRIRNAQ